MRIALLGDYGSIHVQRWSAALAAFRDIDVHLISVDSDAARSDLAMMRDVTTHTLPRLTGTKVDYLLNVRKVRRLIQHIEPDIVHAHYATSYGLLGASCGHHPLVITGWGADLFDSPRRWLMRRAIVHSLSRADAVCVLSNMAKTQMQCFTEKTPHVIPFGVDLEQFAPIDRRGRPNLRIGTIRVLAEKYGVEHLIRGFAMVAAQRADVQLEIVGDGTQRAFLEDLSRELGVADRITFHGYINQNEHPDRYRALLDSFDVFAIVSVLDSETFGVAAVEASACGLPVIASHVGGLPEVVWDQETGILVPPADPAAIAAAISALAIDPTRRDVLGTQGRAFVAERYNWVSSVTSMVAIYERLIEDRA